MVFEKFSFTSLKFFCIFSEYFIGIMSLYILVVFILLTSNIYKILIQKVASEVISFILLLTCFLIYKDILFVNVYQNVFFGFNKFIDVSLLSNFSKFIVCFFSFLFFFIISDFLKDYKITSFEYLLLLMFAVLGLILLCTANDFLTIFLSIELVSLCSYLLASFRKISSHSLESGIKYLVVGAISSSFFLLGSSFIYAYTGTITITDLKFIATNPINEFYVIPNLFLTTVGYIDSLEIYDYYYEKNPFAFYFSFFFPEFFEANLFRLYFYLDILFPVSLNNEIFCYNYYNFFLEIGMIFIIFSIFIKLALAPFHLWSLDVYEGAPSISTFFFSTLTKFSFFVFLSRFCYTFYIYYGTFWVFYNIVVGFLSVFFGSFGGLRQKKIKTLLAYSSISHMGYALLSFSTFSTLGLEMLYFYLISYILSNFIVWYVVLSLKKVEKNYKAKLSKDIGDFVLLGKSNKFLAFGLSVAFFSLAGIPPLLGFMAKFGVFLTLILEKLYLLAVLIILCSVISTFYYVRLIKILYFENVLVGKLYHFNSKSILIFCFFVFSLVFLFFNPTLLYLVIHKMILFENPVNIFQK